MEARNKKIVIITDGAAPVRQMAEGIAASIGGCSGYSVATVQAENFAGTDLLPSDAFFLGCEASKPSSFAYLEDLFAHINMAGRPCGLFSSDARALKYLSALVRDSEAATAKPFLAKNGVAKGDTLQNWAKGILGIQ